MMTCVFAGFCRTSWQRDLSVSYDRVGDVLVAQGKPAGGAEIVP
jgi:hypothetical protein